MAAAVVWRASSSSDLPGHLRRHFCDTAIALEDLGGSPQIPNVAWTTRARRAAGVGDTHPWHVTAKAIDAWCPLNPS
jgi:hypothetical protein